MKIWQRGFSLIELLVVISIIGILASIIYANFNDGSAQARDAKRQADLVNLQAALERFKVDHGHYPSGCNGSTTVKSNIKMSGQIGTSYECPGASGQYIINLAPKYISVLPTDPRPVSGDQGYVYIVNNEGSVYKIMSMNMVETEIVTQNHKFFRCDSSWPLDTNGDYSIPVVTWEDPGICRRTPGEPTGNWNASYETSSVCETPGQYRYVYALSNGFSRDNKGNANYPERGYEYDTEIVRCK